MRTKLGMEALLDDGIELVKGKRVALLACPASVDAQLRSSIERLQAHPAVKLVALFGPEHGIRGEAQAGLKVDSAVDARSGLPVYSLYGGTQAPTAEMLGGIDALIIDLPDGGVRFYTYLATTLYVMRAAAGAEVAIIILDRPAPITGTRVEGPLLDPAFTSFVGPAPLPIRHGMTLGEVARMLNEEEAINCDLTVVEMRHWSREMWFDETGLPFVPASPNLPTLDAMTLYPGTCLVEGTNLSEGRGTTRPFEYIGAPWINPEALADELNALALAGLRFRPVYFVPTFSKHQGEVCAGVHVYVSDRDACAPVTAMLQFLKTIQRLHPDDFDWRKPWTEGEPMPIDLLWGNDSLRRCFAEGRDLDDFIAGWQREASAFLPRRARCLLY